MAQALRADAGRPRSGLAADEEGGLPLHDDGFAPLRAPRLVQLEHLPLGGPGRPRGRACVPRPSPSSVHRQGLEAQYSYTPRCTRHRARVIGWERVDADTTQRRPTRAPTTREAADPNPSPVPIKSRLLNAGSERPESGGRGREVFDSCDLPQSFPVMQRWVGWASRDRRGADQAVDARQTPLGRKKGGENPRAERTRGGENRGLIPSYLISDLPETHVHACQRRYRNGVRGLPSHPPVAVHSRRPRVAPSWARPHSW